MEWNTSFGNFADEPGESEKARHWCRPTLLRTKKKGGVFKVSLVLGCASRGKRAETCAVERTPAILSWSTKHKASQFHRTSTL